MSERFTPTHITIDGTPVVMSDAYDTTDLAGTVVLTRIGRELLPRASEIFPLGSAEAREILGEVTGQDEAVVVADAISDRATLCRWLECVDNARLILADAVAATLSQGDLGTNTRKALETSLSGALTALASFRP